VVSGLRCPLATPERYLHGQYLAHIPHFSQFLPCVWHAKAPTHSSKGRRDHAFFSLC
jgi:hypothetical protein